jgi:hypothetical protein
MARDPHDASLESGPAADEMPSEPRWWGVPFVVAFLAMVVACFLWVVSRMGPMI